MDDCVGVLTRWEWGFVCRPFRRDFSLIAVCVLTKIGQKPWVCPACHRKFSDKRNLKKHLTNIHSASAKALLDEVQSMPPQMPFQVKTEPILVEALPITTEIPQIQTVLSRQFAQSVQPIEPLPALEEDVASSIPVMKTESAMTSVDSDMMITSTPFDDLTSSGWFSW